jgi:hypothetical protein
VSVSAPPLVRSWSAASDNFGWRELLFDESAWLHGPSPSEVMDSTHFWRSWRGRNPFSWRSDSRQLFVRWRCRRTAHHARGTEYCVVVARVQSIKTFSNLIRAFRYFKTKESIALFVVASATNALPLHRLKLSRRATDVASRLFLLPDTARGYIRAAVAAELAAPLLAYGPIRSPGSSTGQALQNRRSGRRYWRQQTRLTRMFASPRFT